MKLVQITSGRDWSSRSEHNVLTARPEGLAEVFLRFALFAVDIGGVKKRDAEVEGLVHDKTRFPDAYTRAEIVAAKSNQGDA
jgi:hypothetical protein